MLKNHFTLALRHLLKQKMYSAIKIGGFALGIAACLLIALCIRDELSYDKSYPDTGRIYRLTDEYKDHCSNNTEGEKSTLLMYVLHTE